MTAFNTPAIAQHNDVLPQTAATCDAHPDWIFCRYAWNDFGTFSEVVERSFGRPCFAQNDERVVDTRQESASCADAVVELWISPKNAQAEDFIERFQNGKRIILFDKSTLSSDLYATLKRSPDAELTSLSHSPSWHINANDALPVHELSTLWPRGDALSAPLRIAWNHPSPLPSPNGAIYAFQTTAKNRSRPGSLTVFRDESLPIELMIHTLDNRAWLESAFKTVCPTPPCRIGVYSPNADYSSMLNRSERHSFFFEFKRSFDEIKTQLPSIPWNTIISIALSFWIGVVIFIVIPPRRPRA